MAAALGSGGGGGGGGGGSGGGGGDEDLSVKTMRKRYEGLLLVRSKAVKGKGAWYWSHLEPILVQNPETGMPKAVKLRCGLCNAMFSASNPSRTASEHLKRGTCPNFTAAPRPLGPSSPPPPPKPPGGRKRASSSSSSALLLQQQQHSQIQQPQLQPQLHHHHHQQPQQQQQQQQHHQHHHHHQQLALVPATAIDERLPLHLSGGKEDLGALALLEDNVKRIKSPGLKPGSSAHILGKEQSEAALNLLAEWLYESYGTVSLSCVEHPKFKAFLNQVGLPGVSRKFLAGARLDARFEEVKRQSEARLNDALFFQLCADGWKRRGGTAAGIISSASSAVSMQPSIIKMESSASTSASELVYITLNLPNGSSLFWRAVPVGASSPKAVEAILEDALGNICAGSPERCVGIVADAHKFAAKALQEIEARRPWMVNVQCQVQAFTSLLKDFAKRSSLFRSVASDCLKLVGFFSSNAPARNLLQRFHRDAYCRIKALADYAEAATSASASASSSLLTLLLPDDIGQSARALHSIVSDASFSRMYADDPAGRDVMELVVAQGGGFWKDLEAVQAMVKVVRGMIRDMELERPLVSQCLPMWEELRDKLLELCARYGKDSSTILRLIQERFSRNYHPAWSAALVLDPLYLVKDSNNRYLPPYKLLSSDQEKDVDRLITRLVSREEAHIVLMELMKWRSEGLDPLYAQAVQVKETDPVTGRVKCMSGQSRRLVWETCLKDFRLLGKVAARLIFLHATSCGLKNWSLKTAATTTNMAALAMGGGAAAGAGGSSSSGSSSSRLAVERAGKMMYIAAHAKLERHDFMSDEEREAILAMEEDDHHTRNNGNNNNNDDNDNQQQQEAVVAAAAVEEPSYLGHHL